MNFIDEFVAKGMLLFFHKLSFFPSKGELVYANYGRYSDFVALKKAGVDVKGKIVMMRYGPTSRGSKVCSGPTFLIRASAGMAKW